MNELSPSSLPYSLLLLQQGFLTPGTLTEFTWYQSSFPAYLLEEASLSSLQGPSPGPHRPVNWLQFPVPDYPHPPSSSTPSPRNLCFSFRVLAPGFQFFRAQPLIWSYFITAFLRGLPPINQDHIQLHIPFPLPGPPFLDLQISWSLPKFPRKSPVTSSTHNTPFTYLSVPVVLLYSGCLIEISPWGCLSLIQGNLPFPFASPSFHHVWCTG